MSMSGQTSEKKVKLERQKTEWLSHESDNNAVLGLICLSSALFSLESPFFLLTDPLLQDENLSRYFSGPHPLWLVDVLRGQQEVRMKAPLQLSIL